MKIRHLKQKIYKWLMPEDDYRAFLMSRVGYPIEDAVTLSTQVVLDDKSHAFLATADGRQKYDAKYGLTRQLADEISEYAKYTETYDEEHGEWTCRVSVRVVK